MKTISYNLPDVAAPQGGCSHGYELRDKCRYLFISGQIPAQPDETVPEGFAEQCEVVWQNIEKVLASAGLTVENLVKVTTYLTDHSQAEENGWIRRKQLGAVQPALTVLVVQTLDPVWLLEIEAIAAFSN